MTEVIKVADHVFEINIPERVEDKDTFLKFMAQIGENKPSKKKKGKGGKGGKKKKKK